MEPRSNMPGFEHLYAWELDLSLTRRKLEVLRSLGHPYDDTEIANAEASARAQADALVSLLRNEGIQVTEAEARSEVVALIAYMQRLGADLSRPPMGSASLDAAAGGS
jgi:cytochrome c oxidase cbb3-type subunit I/II